MPYGEISIIEKDFGQKVNQDVESRHGFAAQASRRKLMAQARNWLLSAALRPYHSWVYWRDVDVETAPFTILEDLMRHNKDVIVPNVWRPLPDWLGGEQPYDLNSWQESETALALADTLDEDAVIVEGYAEYATWRPHLAYLRDPYGDPDMEMDIDGVGGEMEEERKAREKEEQDKADRMKKIKDQFADPNSQWEKDKTDIQNEALREKKEKEKAEAQNVVETQVPADSKPETKAEAKADSKVESKADAVKAQ
ncbi:hypothetical protein M7I_3909 [Glarea lozoyensis 74030]|uniref:Mannan polymerase II complex ANP1 subunit n=1 Tax=Glarea lozoyensis (strain ATCC 74030 / MF5533) TaxID=1104152 RepID=H0EMR5_GLAL7|nr:hypothetical protein M7I_3909 [Glarea lozoyensis 74030]